MIVSILSTIVYAWGDLAETVLHHVLAKKMTYCMTPVYLRNVQLLTYRIYVYFVLGTVVLLVHCVFTQLWPMNVMMGLFISLTFNNVLLCSFYVTEYYEYLWFHGFMMQAVPHSFPYNTPSPVELEN